VQTDDIAVDSELNLLVLETLNYGQIKPFPLPSAMNLNVDMKGNM
jgi:hypothetical protein